MLSYAGRSYDKTKVVSPYKTRQRWLYYQHQPVKTNTRQPKEYQTLETNLRDKRDSFILRYAKDITINTNHEPIYQTIQTASPSQQWAKGACQRYIGDIRDEEYSIELPQNSDHRCVEANHKGLNSAKTTSSGKDTSTNVSHMGMSGNQQNSEKQIKSSPSNFIGKLDLSQLKSTQPSLMKKRSKLTIEIQNSNPREACVKGVRFSSSLGHKYLQQVEKREKMPEFYQIQRSKQSLIRKSFKEPSVNVRFGTFRNSISTRYDRADPSWNLINDTSNCQIPAKDLSYDFNSYSARKLNEVKSKYPHRISMNLYMFPVKELKV